MGWKNGLLTTQKAFSLKYSSCKNFDKVKIWNVLLFLLSSMGLPIPQDTNIDVGLLDLLDKYGFKYRLDKPNQAKMAAYEEVSF